MIFQRSLLTLGIFVSILLSACVATPTLPVTASPTAISAPFTLIETEDYLSDLTINEHWLAWTQFDSKQYSVHVYDLIRGIKHPVPNPQGAAAWLDGDNLYILRYKLDPLRWSFYVLDLNTGQEKLLQDDLSSTKTNGKITAWLQTYPDSCGEKYLDCTDKPSGKIDCSTTRSLMVSLDLATGEKKSIGTVGYSDRILALTSNLVLLQGDWRTCSPIKSYPSPIEAVDLESQEHRFISSDTWTSSALLISAVDRTVVYQSIPPIQTVVQHIEPYKPAERLANVRNIQPYGLAGPDILLYSNYNNSDRYPHVLYAYNLRTSDYQDIPIQGNAQKFIASKTHLAWLMEDQKLYVTRLNLKPVAVSPFQNNGTPTLIPQFLFPLVPTVPPTPKIQPYP